MLKYKGALASTTAIPVFQTLSRLFHVLKMANVGEFPWSCILEERTQL